MIEAIDMHGHFGNWDYGANSLKDRLLSGSIDVVRSRAEKAGIGLTVVSSCEGLVPYGGNAIVANEKACKLAEKYSDILFWAILNPKVLDSFKQVKALLSHPRCAGIKIHPLEHSYEIAEQGDAIFEFAASGNALVLSHSGNAGSFPEDLVFFANKYAQVRLILAHLGWSTDDNFSRQVWALKHSQTGNVYIDTSSVNSMYAGLIEWAVDEIGCEHILFGTDTPLHFSVCQKVRIEYAEIPRDAKIAILRNNAEKLLGILSSKGK